MKQPIQGIGLALIQGKTDIDATYYLASLLNPLNGGRGVALGRCIFS